MKIDKRLVILFGIVAIGLLVTQFFSANKEGWNVYIDDLSVIDETGRIFTDPVSDETLNNPWGDEKLRHLETEVYHSAPFSLALELPDDAPLTADYGTLLFFRNISRGWGTLNFTWYAYVPDLNWHPFSFPIGSGFMARFSASEAETHYRCSVSVGINYVFTGSAKERINAFLRTGFWDQSTERMIPTEKVVPYDWRFDQWYKLSLILSEDEGTVTFYVDDEIVLQSLLLTEYLGNLKEIRYYP